MRKENIGLELSRVIFVGRTYEEYVKMFDLTDEELKNYTILDAPAGACSFTAIASQLGYRVTAADIAYFHSVEQLYQKGMEDIEHAIEGISKVKEKYKWDYFNSIDELEKQRNSALHDCVRHMKHFPELYSPAVLPELPFEIGQFDMILSAHFLFMYADRLDINFHKKTLQEMTRVARKEIRIFPLADLTGNRYENLQEIIMFIHDLGWKAEERIVSYEFQQNGKSILRLYKE
ncbi:hypothetical protein D3C77_380640 [compost metagenome]